MASMNDEYDESIAALMVRWTNARRIRRICEPTLTGPLSTLLIQAALALDREQTGEATQLLARFEAAAISVQRGMNMQTLLRVAAESELEDELVMAATKRWREARKKRLSHETKADGPLRQLVMSAGLEIEARRPTKAMAFLDVFDGLSGVS